MMMTEQRGKRKCTVGLFRWDDELPSLTDYHTVDALVPSLNHLAKPKVDSEWLITIAGRIELSSIGEQCSGLFLIKRSQLGVNDKKDEGMK